MGLFDKFSNILGGNKSAKTETVKGPSTILREHGIDPSNLKFTFNPDGAIGVGGQVADQSECDRICEVLEGMPNVSSVQNNIIVAAPEPAAVPEPEAEAIDDEAVPAGAETKGRTYTVQSGDTLWAIAEKMYGSGGKYMKIFEANTPLLENPDKIFPGQELVIPEIEES